MKRILAAPILLFVGLLPALAANPKAKPDSLLPDTFAGWRKSVPARTSANPAEVDKINSELLKEYGFDDFEDATYTRPDRKLRIKAIRFKDASGAYGAFTFYKAPEMQTEKIGDQAASANDRVLFYRGNVLVQAVLDRVTPMSAAELRELAQDIPLPTGSARNLPSLPMYLPRQGYVSNTAKYVVGPLGLANIGAPIPAEQVEFERGAELAQGQYNSGKGTATLTLVSYPTPQIAGERLHAMDAAHPLPQDGSGLFLSKRSGPLVAIVTGAISPREAKSLLASVNYDAEVTWNERTGLSPRDNVGTLLAGVIVLTGIIIGMALVAGIAFGGIRILAKRLFPDRVFDRSRDVEIIELKLR
ncbi:MAG: hypothetical protein LAO06_09260 [Acidobacteriia bacterium]|nr:hypothetical protein [Terriglobia bacterium]